MFDGLLIGILLHQFACWIGDGRKQETLWVKIMVVSIHPQFLVKVPAEHVVFPRSDRMCPFGIVSPIWPACSRHMLIDSTLAFMMRTFAIGFGDFTNYFNFRWASTFYLFEALLMPPVEVSILGSMIGIRDQ
jgi:hypothetical protein